MTGKIMELVTFNLKAGVSESDAREALKGTIDFVENCKGFIRRTTSVNEDGQWFDVVEWENIENAQAAGAAFMDAPSNAVFMKFIDPDTVTMRHNRKVE